jgi:RNA polymerase sigma factor (sigma-70 family)
VASDASDDRVPDLALLTAWQSGDTTAGERLFDRHADAVARFFENKVRNDAEELVQATFLRMLEGRDRIRDVRAFRAFVFAIARNVLHEHLRELARGREVDPEVDSMVALVPGPSTLVGEREEHRLLLEGLRRLPIEDQILVELAYWEGLDSGALGEIVGMPASSVRTRISRARERLRQTMAELAATPTVLASTFEGMEGWAAELRARLRAGQESRH